MAFQNIIFFLSDQHNPSFCGCYGGITRTRNMDSLAKSGVVFENAYSNCPLCVPSRASMFTGKYAHEIGSWDNATPYDGGHYGLGHFLRDNSVHFTTIGKLDFEPGADVGIHDVRLVKNRNELDVVGLFRQKPIPPRKKMHIAGHWNPVPRQNNDCVKHELSVTDEAIKWILHERPTKKPWVLNINYQRPHPVWQPEKGRYEYYKENIQELPAKYVQKFEELTEVDQNHSRHTCGYAFKNEKINDSHAAYHAAIEELDIEVGRVLEALGQAGIRDEVLIVYASDHGEMARAHGAWGKCSLHEDSIRIPLVISGPNIPAGKRIHTPVSLIDIMPTISDAMRLDMPASARGDSLIDICKNQGKYQDRVVFSESHANGIIAGSFAIIKNKWKLIEYVGYASRLFNLNDDPSELKDLAPMAGTDSAIAEKLQELKDELHSICDPANVDAKVRSDQEILKNQLALSGRLYDELELRGFKRIKDKLLPVAQYA